jgi:hypothetical protein
MVSAANGGMITPERDRDPGASMHVAPGRGDLNAPHRDAPGESDAERGEARRSFARRIDCSGWDAERGVARSTHRPSIRTPNGRNQGGGGHAA